MATTRQRDPFRTQTNATQAAEAIEDAIDEISSRFAVVVSVDSAECGCCSSGISVESINDSNDIAYVQEREVR